ncbi:MAG: carbamoyltransferase HypF, partial [Spirochaetota bacterium]|nr:carbamoyltransferase HypF [Spirochaetota bacterium]
CCNCGPRFTIISELPYDRQRSTMRRFEMCLTCEGEFGDVRDRRFHAQPIACPDCGPKVWYESLSQDMVGVKPVSEERETIDAVVKDLVEGKIVAIKGLGGFHIAVDAGNDMAVRRLRERKHRMEKALAIMIPKIEIARKLVDMSPEEEKLLVGVQKPIVLASRKENGMVADSVAPARKRLGLMLPYTPLHYLILDRFSQVSGSETPALVMTSGNISDEPIVLNNDEARIRLAGIADSCVMHDRDILSRVDDSVVVSLAGESRVIRRSRGIVPLPVGIREGGPVVLAVGGELKNTVCILKEDQAFLSQHIGDLNNLEAHGFFESVINHMISILQIEPELIVHDMHPAYLSTQWAKEQRDIEILAVQHHHGHMASCMAECQVSGPVIGLIMDGTGYGSDGTIWGGEVLIGDYREVTRYASFEPCELPGGDAAIKAPWMTGISYLYKAFGDNMPDLPFMDSRPVDKIIQMIRQKVNSPLTTSCGRLFDAVAVICGGRDIVNYEAQGAIEFMEAADPFEKRVYDYAFHEKHDRILIQVLPIIQSVVQDMRTGESMACISARFHNTMIAVLTELALKAKQQTAISDMVLSGGVFQNELLFPGLLKSLTSHGFHVHSHKQVPCNDGGISLGQAMIGRYSLKS